MLAEQTRDEVFEASVRSQLELIDAALLKAAEADSDMVTEAAQHIIAAGGKRFRPLLVVLGSHLGPREATEDVVKAAVVVELTHVASLYHDDVMDEAGEGTRLQPYELWTKITNDIGGPREQQIADQDRDGIAPPGVGT